MTWSFPATLAVLALPCALAQSQTRVSPAQPCQLARASRLLGTVHDSTMALIPGASISVDGGAATTSGADGHFALPCVGPGSHTLAATAAGFAPLTMQLRSPRGGELELVLQPDTVQTSVQVNGDVDPGPGTGAAGPAETLAGQQLQSLADDPDDLQRQLQQLAASTGASPANVTISVDGFQDSSKLPPKSSIAYIKINPDLYSAEYREPPFDGARVEVYTKPGQSRFHGALFATNGSPWMNARDPFSTSG